MAIKLYPPVIEENLPAFYKNYENNDVISASLQIPFGVSKAVSLIDVAAIQLKIKTVSTNQVLFNDIITTYFDKESNGVATFILTKEQAEKLNEGQYYKIQLAFCSIISRQYSLLDWLFFYSWLY